MRLSLLLPLLAACHLDSALTPKDGGEVGFDSGETAAVVDTAETAETADTAESADSLPLACPDQAFPGGSVTQLAECTSYTPGVIDPVIRWTNPAVGDVIASPAVGHLTDDDGDGVPGSPGDVPDIVAVNVYGDVYALSGADGHVLWSLPTDLDLDPASPAIGDLDGDGWADVVVSGLGGTWAFHGEDGRALWTGGRNGVQCGAVALADMDADGQPEVLLGRSILSGADGSLLGDVTHGIGSGITIGLVMGAVGVAADIDGDGTIEAVAGNAVYGPDGAARWYNGESDGWVGVADFDGDVGGEIVASADGTVRLEDDDGTVLWAVPLGSDKSGPPTIADFDGDGNPEIGVGNQTSYRVLDGDGTELWETPIDDSSSGSVVGAAFDFDGDGRLEIVVADEEDVWILDGRDGTVRFDETAHSSPTCGESAVIADVDADGSADIVYGSYAVFGPETGITVMSSGTGAWRPARPTWNQHGYSITNIDDDGTVPSPAMSNWPTYNTFRATTTSGPGNAADLTPVILDVCTDTCAEGTVRVWVAVENRGLVDVAEPVAVAIYGDSDTGRVLLGTTTVAGAFAGWRTDAVQLDLEGVPSVIHDLVAVVDEPGAVRECDEANEMPWNHPVCG